MDSLSLTAARNLQLAAQGLLEPPQYSAPNQPGCTKADILDCIRRMGVLQIDTISVVARAPYFVLFSRLGEYNPAWLDETHAEGGLFEYWAHAACFIPIEDYPLFRRGMIDSNHPYIRSEWLAERGGMVADVLERVRSQGAVRSIDFQTSQRTTPWWGWKDEKIVLEHLHYTGELMIARREKFQRVYDLRQRVLPGWDDCRTPEAEYVRRELLRRSVLCLGLAHPAWVADYYRLKKNGLTETLKEMAASGELLETGVDGMEGTFYIHPANQALYDAAAGGALIASLTTLLSPFDPLVWDRARARQLFNFDYTIEAYTPPAKRRYGYFCLPILRRGELIGRLDAKAQRSKKTFEVRMLHFEPGVEPGDPLLADLAGALQRCADWHTCPQVCVTAEQHPAIVEKLKRLLAEL